MRLELIEPDDLDDVQVTCDGVDPPRDADVTSLLLPLSEQIFLRAEPSCSLCLPVHFTPVSSPASLSGYDSLSVSSSRCLLPATRSESEASDSAIRLPLALDRPDLLIVISVGRTMSLDDIWAECVAACVAECVTAVVRSDRCTVVVCFGGLLS